MEPAGPSPEGAGARECDPIDALMPVVYDELRRLARAYLRGGQQTMQATALVNEAYIKLAEAGNPVITDRTHFFALAARVMRQVLVDYARSKRAQKRGAGVRPLELHEEIVSLEHDAEQVLAIHEALDRLTAHSPERGRLIEMRFFGGMTGEECGEALGISTQQAYRELRLAQAWLHAELST
jgi:RNA polymerase sigma factor (TIGR02999 family)